MFPIMEPIEDTPGMKFDSGTCEKKKTKSKMVTFILVTKAVSLRHFKNYTAYFPGAVKCMQLNTLLKDIEKQVRSVR